RGEQGVIVGGVESAVGGSHVAITGSRAGRILRSRQRIVPAGAAVLFTRLTAADQEIEVGRKRPPINREHKDPAFLIRRELGRVYRRGLIREQTDEHVLGQRRIGQAG